MKTYAVPPKVRAIVIRDTASFADRILWASGDVCPLKGSVTGTKYALDESRGYEPVGCVSDGCTALNDPVCYLNGPRGRRRVGKPDISKKEDCPIYKKVLEIIKP